MSHPPHTVAPRAGHPHTHTIIFLHGRDSTAQEFADELFESEVSHEVAERLATAPAPAPGPAGGGRAAAGRTLPELFPTVRWVFPSTPVVRSARFGADMSQWYDMWSVADPRERSEVQAEGMRASAALLRGVVGEEEGRVPRQKILLAGISQGFTAALAALLADGRGGFAGLVGWCGWMPPCVVVEDDAREAGRVPVFLAHAGDDEVVPLANGEVLCSTLRGRGFAVEWHVYEDGGHWINEPQGMDDMSLFIQRAMDG